jgi:signal recognition particle receptor subunit beta
VVFVADSAASQREANRVAWAGMQQQLGDLGLHRCPVVVQYNKRDLPDVLPIDQVDHFGDPKRPVVPACAKDGEGVVQTFFELVGNAWTSLDKDLQLSQKLKIDAQSFRRSLAEHLGIPESAG